MAPGDWCRVVVVVAGIAACGGGGSNPIDAPQIDGSSTIDGSPHIDAVARDCEPGDHDCPETIEMPAYPPFMHRTYLLTVPAGYDDAVPNSSAVVLVLHGFSGSAMMMVGETG